jgi:peptide/nickel transport system substrate-binding protein
MRFRSRMTMTWSAAILVVALALVGGLLPVKGTLAQGTQRVVVGLEGEPPHLDMTAATLDLITYAGRPVYESLLTWDADMKPQPLLATKWEWVNPTTLKFTLRQGVMFHNGRELVADDVKATIERVKDEKTGSSMRTSVEPIKEVQVTDKYNGTIITTRPAPSLTSYVLMKLPIAPKEAFADLKTKPVGTGPFMFKEWVKGERIVLVKNPNYWQKGQPNLDELVFRFFPEYQTEIAAFKAGEVHMITWLSATDVPAFKNDATAVVDGKPLFGFEYVGFNTKRAPYDNVKVRQAIKYALDKAVILKAAQFGVGDIAAINEIKSSPYYSTEFDYGQDLTKAKKLLAESGHAKGFSATVFTANNTEEGAIADTVAFQIGKIGIKAKVEKVTDAVFFERAYTRHDYDILINGYSGVPDPDFFNYRYFHSKGTANIFQYSNPALDKLLDQGRTTVEVDKRKPIYRDVYKHLVDQTPAIFVFNEYRFMLWKKNVTGFSWNSAKRYEFGQVKVQ